MVKFVKIRLIISYVKLTTLKTNSLIFIGDEKLCETSFQTVCLAYNICFHHKEQIL